MVLKEFIIGYHKVGLGVRYSIKDFSRMFYLESRLDQGKTSDNERQGNQIIAGIRWAF